MKIAARDDADDLVSSAFDAARQAKLANTWQGAIPLLNTQGRGYAKGLRR